MPHRTRFHSGLARGRFRVRARDCVRHRIQPCACAAATKADVTPALKEGSALQLPGYRRFGLRNLLMVAQVTGSLMLLLITGFLVMGLSQDEQHPNQI